MESTGNLIIVGVLSLIAMVGAYGGCCRESRAHTAWVIMLGLLIFILGTCGALTIFFLTVWGK